MFLSFFKHSLLFFCLSVSSFVPAAEPKDFAGFRGDCQHTGVYQSAPVDTFHQILWKFQTASSITSSPVYYKGRIYLAAGNYLYALSTQGKEIFKFRVEGSIDCTPALCNDAAFFQTDEGVAYAVDINSGAELWKTTPGTVFYLKLYDFWDYYLSSPVVYNDMVFFGSGDGNIYALSCRTGEKLWSFKTGNAVRSTPAVDQGVLYAGSFDGYFYAIDASNGSLKWKYQMKEKNYSQRGEIQSSPCVSDGVVYFGSRNAKLYALDAATGGEKWNFAHDNGSWVIASPAVKDGLVFAGSSDAHFFNAVDAKTGREVWRTPVKKNVFSSAAVAGDVVYFGEGNAYTLFETSVFYALDATTGRLKWSMPVPAQVWSSPAVAGGVVYFGCMDGILYAVK